MRDPLGPDSRMECRRHGVRRPAFVCRQLMAGGATGFHESFHESDDPPDPDWPFRNAWCDACEDAWHRHGGWNDASEEVAGVTAVCEGCYEDIRRRQLRN